MSCIEEARESFMRDKFPDVQHLPPILCPKCGKGFRSFDGPKYVAEHFLPTDKPYLISELEPERLTYTCGQCGFVMTTPCNDS